MILDGDRLVVADDTGLSVVALDADALLLMSVLAATPAFTL